MSCATIADAYSHGSRRIRSGCHELTVASIDDNIASVATAPKRSRFAKTAASCGDATGSCSRIGATIDSGGSPPGENGKPVAATMLLIAGGATIRVSCPAAFAASSIGSNGCK